MSWVKVCEDESLKPGELFEFDYQDKKILLVKLDNKIYASDRICTHAYADLVSGILNEKEKTVTCPLHMSVFNLENGIPQNLPAEEPLKLYQTKISDGEILLLI